MCNGFTEEFDEVNFKLPLFLGLVTSGLEKRDRIFAVAVASDFLFDVSTGDGKPRSFQKKPYVLSLVLLGI